MGGVSNRMAPEHFTREAIQQADEAELVGKTQAVVIAPTLKASFPTLREALSALSACCWLSVKADSGRSL
jgi:hypothetical protein